LGNIILPAKEYRRLYDKYITEIPNEKASEYYASLYEISVRVQEYFPFLIFTILPTAKPNLAFFKGLLIPKEKMLRIDREENEDKGLPILAVIPLDYKRIGIDVFDCCGRINWEAIEDKYRHRHANTDNKICTHHRADINEENCVIGVLKSAYYLFDEYRKYEKTGRFDLKCHPHGELIR
jgi:hypothetical protein